MGNDFLAGKAVLVVAMLCLLLTGCSMSMQLPSMVDPDETGSLPSRAPGSPQTKENREAAAALALAPEDAIYARAAIERAMSAEPGSGDVVWKNPDSGRSGRIVRLPTDAAQTSDRCRRFESHNNEPAAKTVSGKACPDEWSSWQLAGQIPK